MWAHSRAGVRIVTVRIVAAHIAAGMEVQTRKVRLARNSVISSREVRESHVHSVHCASGYENGSRPGADRTDHWSENMGDNDGLAPSVPDQATEDMSATELGLASASWHESPGDRNNRNWDWGSAEYRKPMARSHSIFEVAF